ncbi:GAF domain-containing protein [Dyadobacter soli]|uniref:histidine kinase n=1 Tax=Dyadobacter soli TaxID=659014 RepID=A0A1G7QCY8_9BACT|nr:GAF domain-containing protein [Dyadobacter soli]SDF96315.1 GAF domain-containing protein [Dyadobacter soli]
MHIVLSFKDLLFDPAFANFIISIQIPIVLCLILQSIQAYRMRIENFDKICLAWFVNFVYLFAIIYLRRFPLPDESKLIIRTVFDLTCVYIFFLAAKNYYPFFGSRPRLFALCLLISGILKVIPSTSNLVPFIHVRYIPVAVIDFSVLVALSVYFLQLSRKYLQRNFLFFSTLGYAAIQLLPLIQINILHEKPIPYIDNVGFFLGLLFKTGILITLSALLIKITSSIERSKHELRIKQSEKILQKLTFASKVFLIRNEYSSKENASYIIRNVLRECLDYLDEQLGYFAFFDAKKDTLKIEFASNSYRHLEGHEYSASQGITGNSVREKKQIVVDREIEKSDYMRFDNQDLDKNVKSAVAIPLLESGQVLGVFMFESEKENSFTDSNLNILNATVSQALVAISNVNLVKELEQNRNFLNDLKQIDRNMVDKSFRLSDILSIILRQSLDLVGGNIGFIALFDPKLNVLRIVETTELSTLNKIIDISDSISGLAVKTKDKVYIPDITKSSTDMQELFKDYLGDSMICELVVPLIVQGEVIGVVNTESDKPDMFSDSDIGNVQAYAGQASVAIHIAQLFEKQSSHLVREMEHRRRLEALAEIDLSILNANKGLSEILDLILSKGLSLLGKSFGAIMLAEQIDGKLSLVVKKSTNSDEDGKVIPGRSISALVLKMGKSLFLPDVERLDLAQVDDLIGSKAINLSKYSYYTPSWGKMRSELIVPLTLRGEVIGVINIESPEINDFTDDDRGLLTNLAMAAAIAIQNARLFEEIVAKNIALENSVDKDKIRMSDTLGKVIDHRIGNSIGLIRSIVKDNLLDDRFNSEYGQLNEKMRNELGKILTQAEKVLSHRDDLKTKISNLLFRESTEIDFMDIKKLIDDEEWQSSDKKYKVNVVGFENLKSIYANLDLLIDGVFFELIRNAIKSMPEGGSILVEGKRNGMTNVIHVVDRGCGIDKYHQRRVFEEGYTKWSNGMNGRGIGLYELKTIVKFYGGEVSVTGNGAKGGTTFRIEFPIDVKNLT